MKKLFLVFPIVALLAAGCNSSQQANNQTSVPTPVVQNPTGQTTNPTPTSTPTFGNNPANNTAYITLVGTASHLPEGAPDLGAVSAALTLETINLALKQSPEQKAAEDKLLNEQQDPSSPNYHKWLTSEQYGQMFGASDQNITAVTAWLTKNGFTKITVANGKNWIAFTGNAGQVENAFRLQIHNYKVNGKQCYANPTDQQIPAAFASFVSGITSLSNCFPPQPASNVAK